MPEPAEITRAFPPAARSRLALVVHVPAQGPEQRRDPAVTVPAEFRCQFDDGPGQGLFIIGRFRGPALGCPGLAECTADLTFGYLEPASDVLHTPVAT